MIDYILDFGYVLLIGAIELLPESPFADIGVNLSGFKNIMGMINYFVPVGSMLGIFTVYLTAVGLWYFVRWIMRLVQYID